MDTYMSNRLLMQTTSSMSALSSLLKEKDGCPKFVPSGDTACEMEIIETLNVNELPCAGKVMGDSDTQLGHVRSR